GPGRASEDPGGPARTREGQRGPGRRHGSCLIRRRTTAFVAFPATVVAFPRRCRRIPCLRHHIPCAGRLGGRSFICRPAQWSDHWATSCADPGERRNFDKRLIEPVSYVPGCVSISAPTGKA